MKRIVIACDGTWQDLKTPDPTNVRRVVEATLEQDGDIEQIVCYNPGIGTRSVFEKYTGGAFGLGINVEIATAYTFLCSNYSPGDELYLFGFSRGAYTVRSLAGLIYSCGILRREELSWLPNAYALYRNLNTPDRENLAIRLQKIKGHGQTSEDPVNSNIRINFLGVWDTVGALGIPDLSKIIRLDRRSRDQHRFHNTFLSPIVDNARHAVAIDEQRKLFRHTEMNPLQGKRIDPASLPANQIRQVWFPGDHGCIGGGGDGLPQNDPQKLDKKPHSDSALEWMIQEIEAIGPSHLKVSRDILGLAPDPTAPFGTEGGNFNRRMADPLAGKQPEKIGARDNRPFCKFEDLHPSVITRWENDKSYRPQNLVEAHGERLG